MLSIPSAVRIWASRQPVDLRKSFDGLAALVRQELQQDPLSGHLFLFCNRRGDRLKILYWDRDGYALWYKRLEEGTFRLPALATDAAALELRAADLTMLLDGVDWTRVKRSRRYERPAAKQPA